MAWFRVDDAFHSHPKVMRAGTAAVGLWVRCGSYCAQHLTDGVVPREVVMSYGTKTQVAALLSSGLFVESPSGYVMPDYLDYNPSREEVLAGQAAKHAAKARAGQAGGIASGVARRKHSTKQTRSRIEAEHEAKPKQNEAPTRPVPNPTQELVVQQSSLVPFRSGSENSAEAVVAAFMSAAAEAGLTPPGERTRNKIGRTALSMLHDGADIRRLIQAARALALKPYDDLEREVRIFETEGLRPGAAPARVAYTATVLKGAFSRASEAEGDTA